VVVGREKDMKSVSVGIWIALAAAATFGCGVVLGDDAPSGISNVRGGQQPAGQAAPQEAAPAPARISGACLQTFAGHKDWVIAVAVSPDQKRIVSASKDGWIIARELETGEIVQSIRYVDRRACDSEIGITALADGRFAVVIGSCLARRPPEDLRLEVWSPRKALEGDAVRLDDDERLVPDTRRGRAVVWDTHVLDGAPNGWRQSPTSWEHSVTAVGLAANGLTAFAGLGKGGIACLYARGFAPPMYGTPTVAFFPRGAGAVSAMTVAYDGSTVVSGSINGHIEVWSMATGTRQGDAVAHDDAVTAIALTPNGDRAITGSSSGELKVWDLGQLTCLHTLKGHTDAINALAVLPDGQRAVSGSEDGTLRVWDLTTGDCLATLTGHDNAVLCLAVTPDGKRVVSGSADNTIKVWDLTPRQ
jgi:WD40 repeat protein